MSTLGGGSNWASPPANTGGTINTVGAAIAQDIRSEVGDLQRGLPNPIVPSPPVFPPAAVPAPQPDPLQVPEFSPQTPEVPPSDVPDTITVDRFEFEGNTAFSDAELAAVTRGFTGRPLSFGELLQVEALVTKTYTDAGYINSGAVIPAGQTFPREGAVVTVQIIEGGVEAIEVRGTQRLRPSYVRSRLAIAMQAPLSRERLLEALQLLQLNPLIESISAELQAGTRPELSLLKVQVAEADAFAIDLFADNGRVPSVGSFERGVELRHGNLSGMGDALALTYTNTDGSNEYEFSYALPVNPRNGTVRLYGSLTNTEVIEEPFDRIDITGESKYLELSFRQPIIEKPNRELALGLIGSFQESQTFLLGEEFPLSPGANENGITRVTAVRFFQDYLSRQPRAVFAARSQFNIGLDAFGATVNEDAPDSRFFSWRGQAQYVRLLARDTLLVLRSDVQLTPNSLIPLEQISIGGLNSVRGYRQDALLADNGIFASVEVRIPVLRIPDIKGILQVAPFIDFGVGWNHSQDYQVQGTNTLVGTGLGLVWQMGDRLSARLDWGIPLTDREDSDRTWQENGIYFSVRFTPF
ncbi:ShlB/FhaC/HecB family hemolysin secretion/activation protein [Trichothermofontia sp.]